ncbi:MAG: dihydrolipoyl dehydrogenase [Phycisphaerae bacterium]
MSEHFDIAVLGTGPGGYIAALKAAQMGASVAVVEKHLLGGTCLNYGCIPSKALLATAELLHNFSRASSYGIEVDGKVGFDWTAVQKRKDKVLAGLRGGIGSLFKARKVKLFEGTAKLTAKDTVQIERDGKRQTIQADKIILAVGSVPSRIPGWPDDPEIVCTSDEALHWDELPRNLLIVGGGVIGVEFACMMQQYGVDVTVVEMLPKLVPNLDAELGDALAAEFKKRRITCYTDVKVDQLKTGKKSVTAGLSNGESVKVDKVLVATGRRANTQDIGLEELGIETRRGFVKVDNTMQTTVEGIYCIGDANGLCLLAHAASAQGVAAVENALGQPHHLDAPIPWCVYTFPEIAGVGITEAQAAEQDLPVSIGRFPIGHLGKAMAVGHTDGFVKVIRHRETDAILGVHMIGHNVTEIIAAAAALMHTDASTTEMAETVFAHPTISESVKEAAEDALGAAMHLPPKKLIRLTAEA